jgi:hypothetical protein
MTAKHAALLVAIGGFALLGAGCYGDTDAPTEVGAHAATLNAHGKANNGPAYTYFEYWKSANPANKLKTQTRTWPAGAEGAFKERPQHLSEETDYAYRLCGNDQGKPAICASTKKFTTGRARSTVAIATVNSSGMAQFTSDPGVNDNFELVQEGGWEGSTAFRETFCAAMTCGSHIIAGDGCSDASGSGYSTAYCWWNYGSSPAINIELGDLDDTAYLGRFLAPDLTLDGGSGNDSLVNDSISTDESITSTITGGNGQDVMTGSDHMNDTIKARSASFLNADTDKSISCGGGEDTVIADPSDPISAGQNGCETVLKP